MATKRKTRRKATSSSDDPVTAYAQAVDAGAIVAGRLVRLACARHLRDLERADLEWDLKAALRAINFFRDVLRLNGGDFEGKPFVLQPWQAFIVGSLFGWKGDDGYRRFRNAYVEIGKGNGKSPLAAGIGHYMLSADKEPRAEIYAAATKRDQAMILFRDAVAMREQSPALKKRLKPSGSGPLVWNLANEETKSFFRAISSDENSQSGPRPHCGLIDEVHEHKTPVVVDMIRAGVKGRKQPLIFEITNSGWNRMSVCWHHHEYSTKVLEGTLEDEAWFAYVAGLDSCESCRAEGKDMPVDGCEDCDDWRDPAVWLKANPNLGVSIGERYLRDQVREATGMPTKEGIVKRLNFCLWTLQQSIWIPVEAWKACEDLSPAGSFEALRGRPCFLGTDLSSKDDLTSVVAYFPPAGEDKRGRVLAWYWLPEQTIVQRVNEARVPYDLWVSRKLIKATPGNRIDYDFIRETVRTEIAPHFQIVQCAVDPWNAANMVSDFQADGLTVVEVPPATIHFSPAMKEVDRLVAAGELAHDGNPVLAWNISNLAPLVDARNEIRPDRANSREKIDGAVALIMAVGRAHVTKPKAPSVYEKRGLLTV